MYWTVVIGILTFFLSALDAQMLKTQFSCNGRTTGYYADMETGCQVYHMCDGLGRQFTYSCPNATLFQQRMLICDHWYMVNCSRSEVDYAANLRIGQRERPFVDDSESNPYQRTPRPDLLSHSPGDSEYNTIYRSGKKIAGSNVNVVGAESDTPDFKTEEPVYFLPSHWSTEFSRYSSTTGRPQNDNIRNKEKADVFGNKKNVVNNVRIKGKPVVSTLASTELPQVNYRPNSNDPAKNPSANTNTNDRPAPKVNFHSRFRATTPVYPLSVEPTSPDPSDSGLLPPRGSKIDDPIIVNDVDTSFSQNKNKFKGTTPVYPSSVEPTSPDPSDSGLLPPLSSKFKSPIVVNDADTSFSQDKNKFRGTTPVYPLSVESTSPDPSDSGLLPPLGSKLKGPIVVNDADTSFSQNNNKFRGTTPVYPSSVEPTSPDPSDSGLLPPLSSKFKSPIVVKDADTSFSQDKNKFRGTTPVYPLSVESTSPDPSESGLLPPLGSKLKGPIVVNDVDTSFSQDNNKFRGTTPVYPTSVEPTSPEPFDLGILPPGKPGNINKPEDLSNNELFINFNQADNKFKGTTPVYPLTVESTSLEPSILGVLPPVGQRGSVDSKQGGIEVPSLNLGFEPPKIDLNFKPHTEQVVPQAPSKFYQPPKFEPDYSTDFVIDPAQEESQSKRGGFKSLNSEEWEDLRKKFLIPDYEFPLDSVARPSYDSVLSSFHVDPDYFRKK